MYKPIWVFLVLVSMLGLGSLLVSGASASDHMWWFITWCPPLVIGGLIVLGPSTNSRKLVLSSLVLLIGGGLWLLVATTPGAKFQPNFVSYLAVIASWLAVGVVLVLLAWLLARCVK